MMQETGFDFEVVIADDHSTDGTLAIAQAYEEKYGNVRILSGEGRNLGITRNYQRGLQACRGEYIAIVEGDDFWISPAKLQKQVEFLNEHPECALCCHRFFRHDERWGKVDVYPAIDIAGDFMVFEASSLARSNVIGNFSTCMYRAELVHRLNPALFELRIYDWMFNLVMAQQGLIGYLMDIMSVYRIHAQSSWAAKPVATQVSEVLSLLDPYNKYFDFKFTKEFQSLRKALLGELSAATSQLTAAEAGLIATESPKPSFLAHLEYRTSPFLPPLAVTAARKTYRLARKTARYVLAGRDLSKVGGAATTSLDLPSITEDLSKVVATIEASSGAVGVSEPFQEATPEAKPLFTAHNIRLDNGTYTKPDMPSDMSKYPRFLAAKKVLDLLFGNQRERYSLVDVGCLEGGYTVEFARMGFNCLGIEARRSNLEACRYVKQNVALPNLNFVRDDARRVDAYGEFDITFCCGLLYHLDQPRQFIQLLSQVTKQVLIVETHFAADTLTEGCELSAFTNWEGANGRWFTEFPANVDIQVMEQSHWASWGNAQSFWLTRPWILQTLYDAGFDLVFEQFDGLGPEIASSMNEGEYFKQNRGTFVGIKIAR